MERKNVIKLITAKYKMGRILMILAIILLSLFIMATLAETIIENAIIEDEKTTVRTAASLSRGANANNIVDINELTTYLSKYAGSGKTTAVKSTTEIIQVTFADTGNMYEINVNTGPTFDDPEGTIPYMPIGYTAVEGTDLSTGFVIEDESGNQFVWVEVPRTTTVYPTAGLNITSFTNEEYKKIENDLHTYTSKYRNGTAGVDEWSTQAATGLTQNEYYTIKKTMLKSIYQNGGFYVGRYETGIDYSQTHRTTGGNATQTPVIKQNAYPYNFVTYSQTQNLASTFATDGYTSSIPFGVQWDLILKYLETKGVAQTKLTTNSTELGNYNNTFYSITNTSAKYSTDVCATWLSAPYSKTTAGTICLTTGATNVFSMQNIYDLAGNMWETTLEYSNNSSTPCTARGGSASNRGDATYASFRSGVDTATTYLNRIAFRVVLYRDEGIEGENLNKEPTYIPEGYTHVSGTDMDTGYVIQDGSGNQYVWVEVPRTEEVYPTAGLNIMSFGDTEYQKIENDLHTYTATYRNGTTYVDEWSSQSATGLTQAEYYTIKETMLKSIYENGGFYVGRYETGIDYSQTHRTTGGNTTQTPVIKQNAYPYNFVTYSQTQNLASTFATDGYTSSIPFGVQWDLILKYLETKGVDPITLTTESTVWGNYIDTTYNITNTSAKYSTDNASTWVSAPYSKTTGGIIYLTTGASSAFSMQNIYDLAGNMWETTLEYSNNSSTPCTARGGSGKNYGFERFINWRSGADTPTTYLDRIGFRVTLYKD